MIKVNLLRTIGGPVSASGTTVAHIVTDDSKKQGGLRLAVILAFPILLYVYELMSVSGLESQLQTVQAELAQIEAQRSTFGDVGPRVERYTKQKAKIDKELEVVRDLARTRLREVKSLDAIQSLITGKTWIRRLSIKGNQVSLEGYTQSNDGVSELMQELNSSTVFSKVVPKATSQAEVRGGTAKKFQLDFQIGKN